MRGKDLLFSISLLFIILLLTSVSALDSAWEKGYYNISGDRSTSATIYNEGNSQIVYPIFYEYNNYPLSTRYLRYVKWENDHLAIQEITHNPDGLTYNDLGLKTWKLDNLGKAHAIYVDGRQTNPGELDELQLFHTWYESGEWKKEKISNVVDFRAGGTRYSWEVSINFDSSNNIYIVYPTRNQITGNTKIIYAKRTGLNNWINEVVKSYDSLIPIYSLNLEIDSIGQPHILFVEQFLNDINGLTLSVGQNFTFPYQNLMYGFKTSTTSQWQTSVIDVGNKTVGKIDGIASLINRKYDLFPNINLALDSHNQPHIAYEKFHYQNGQNVYSWDELIYMNKTNEAWKNERILISRTSCGGSRIACADHFCPINIERCTAHGGASPITAIDDTMVMRYISMAIDNLDKVHIAYFYNKNLTYGYYQSGSWNTKVIESMPNPFPVTPTNIKINPLTGRLVVFASGIFDNTYYFTPKSIVAETCPNNQIIMKLSAATNAHGAKWNDATYPVSICYDTIFGKQYTPATGEQVHDTNGKVIYLSDRTNAHASVTNKEGYIPISFGNLTCRSTTGSCNINGEKLVVSLSGLTNAHIANDSSYGIKICCSPTGIQPTNTCGNGRIDPGEECDGSLLPFTSCLNHVDLCTGGSVLCYPSGYIDNGVNKECKLNINACTGCQASGICGDGVINNLYERCDGTNLNGLTCSSFNLLGTELRCNAPGTPLNCTFDTSGCIAPGGTCNNNGQCNTGENCQCGDCYGEPANCGDGQICNEITPRICIPYVSPSIAIIKPTVVEDINGWPKYKVGEVISFEQISKGSRELNVTWNFGNESGKTFTNCLSSGNCNTTGKYSLQAHYIITATAIENKYPDNKAVNKTDILVYKEGINVFAIISNPGFNENIEGGRPVYFNGNKSFVANCSLTCQTGKTCYDAGINNPLKCYNLEIPPQNYNFWFDWAITRLNPEPSRESITGIWNGDDNYSKYVEFNKQVGRPGNYFVSLRVGYEAR